MTREWLCSDNTGTGYLNNHPAGVCWGWLVALLGGKVRVISRSLVYSVSLSILHQIYGQSQTIAKQTHSNTTPQRSSPATKTPERI